MTGEILFDEFAELPTIDYQRDAGLDYAVAYAAGGRKDRPEGFYNQLLRFDLGAIRCDAGSRIGVILENRYSFRGRMVRIVLKA